MAKLTSDERKKLPAKDFAVKGGKYPIEDKAHARNALSRVAQHGTSEQKKEVKVKVHAKYPEIGKKEKKYNPHQHSYQGKDSRDGRLHTVKTKKGDFRFKDNRKDD